jgi:ABC-type glycerol-3-phosphate transport system substrate-binding protein
MASYARHYGSDNLAAFRKGDQSLLGKASPLLPLDDQEMSGRFTQYREAREVASPEFGVCPLPILDSGSPRKNAEWVNGNFFVFPQGAEKPKSDWEFAKFWVGFTPRRKLPRPAH